MKFSLPTPIGFSLLISFASAAQDFEVPDLPATKGEFVKSEKHIINADKEGKLEDSVKETMKKK